MRKIYSDTDIIDEYFICCPDRCQFCFHEWKKIPVMFPETLHFKKFELQFRIMNLRNTIINEFILFLIKPLMAGLQDRVIKELFTIMEDSVKTAAVWISKIEIDSAKAIDVVAMKKEQVVDYFAETHLPQFVITEEHFGDTEVRLEVIVIRERDLMGMLRQTLSKMGIYN